MLAGGVAKRYAQALYELAVEKNQLESLEKELLQIASVLETSEDLSKILYNPRVDAQEKIAFLEQLFKGQLSELTANFLGVVVEKSREMYLISMINEYVRLADEARNIAKATVYSAFKLNNKVLAQLKDKLAKITCKDTVLETVVQPELIGGIVVRIGDKVYDASVKNNLGRLRDQLKQIQL